MLTWLMFLTLLVPGLLWPREILRDTTFDLALPALTRILGRARIDHGTGLEHWLASAFAIEQTPPATLPSAALRMLGEGGKPGDDHWLCLDPVHLHLREWAVIPSDPTTLALSVQEDAALREAVAPLFADLGELMATTPGHWHLHLARPAMLETRPLAEAVGRAVEPNLPDGQEGAEWRRRLAEAQPLLHNHRVNRERVLAGRPTVNHLWLWGPGKLPTGAQCPAQCPYDQVMTDDPVLRGLAQLAGCPATSLAVGFEQAALTSQRCLVKLDHLATPSAELDTQRWREELLRLETNWFAPLLRRPVPPRLSLVATGHGQSLIATASSLGLRRFWKPSISLADSLPQSTS